MQRSLAGQCRQRNWGIDCCIGRRKCTHRQGSCKVVTDTCECDYDPWRSNMTVRQKRKTERAKTEVQDQQERDYLTSERRNQCPAESKGNQADVQSLPAVVSNEKSLSVLVAKHEPRSSPEADNYSDLASRDTLQTVCILSPRVSHQCES